jgi:imidazolonepropionase
MPVLRNIAQLATCPPNNPQQDAGLIDNAALVWTDGTVRWAGPAGELPSEFRKETVLDCERRLVVPGLVDCHTHLCFGGWRGDEFDLRLRGASYQEIAAAGGGIASTVAATRGASTGHLVRKARSALDGMLALGVTTVECKTGYGLDEANELKQLEVYRQLNGEHAVELVPTYLGAHIVPQEFSNDRDRYISLICDVMIPLVAQRKLAQFCDAFIEEGAYTVNEARRIFEVAADHGLGIKVHADQLSDSGGARLAAEMNAVSAEHLEYISKAPYLSARDLMEAGVPVAVATDFNPGSAPSYHLPFAMMLACLNQGMTPQEALNGATTIAARAVGRQQSIGSLIPGYQADLAIIDAPSLNHWLYHFVPNACASVVKRGEFAH